MAEEAAVSRRVTHVLVESGSTESSTHSELRPVHRGLSELLGPSVHQCYRRMKGPLQDQCLLARRDLGGGNSDVPRLASFTTKIRPRIHQQPEHGGPAVALPGSA